MAFAMSGVSTGAVTKELNQVWYRTADALATVEGAGYFNVLAVDSKVPAIGVLTHIDTNLNLITQYAYTHDGATFTLATGTKSVLK